MGAGEVVAIAVAALALIGAAVPTIALRKQNAAQTRVLDVTAVKTITETATGLVTPLKEEVVNLRKQIDALEKDRDDKIDNLTRTVNDMRAHQIEHDQILTVHRAWDIAVISDPTIAARKAPPPLYVVKESVGE